MSSNSVKNECVHTKLYTLLVLQSRLSIYCYKSSEDFISCWYSSEYCCWCKVCLCVNVCSYCKCAVFPYYRF